MPSAVSVEANRPLRPDRPAPGRPAAVLQQRAPLLDLPGSLTMLAGTVLALIALFSSYDHVDLLDHQRVELPQQLGVWLIALSLPLLALEAQLATRRRFEAETTDRREQDSAARERAKADRERDRAAEERERQVCRTQRQTRCALAQLQHQLDPTIESRRRLRAVIALLREYGELG